MNPGKGTSPESGQTNNATLGVERNISGLPKKDSNSAAATATTESENTSADHRLRQRKRKWGFATETEISPPEPASAAPGAGAVAASPATATADVLPPIDHGSAAQQLKIIIEHTEALCRRTSTGMREALFPQLHLLYFQQAGHARSMVPPGRPTSCQPGSGAAAGPNPLTVNLAKAVAARIGSGFDGAVAAGGSEGAGALAGAGVSDATGGVAPASVSTATAAARASAAATAPAPAAPDATAAAAEHSSVPASSPAPTRAAPSAASHSTHPLPADSARAESLDGLEEIRKERDARSAAEEALVAETRRREEVAQALAAEKGKREEAVEDRVRCVVCYDRVRTVYFQTCHHLVVCGQCSDELSACPICNTIVRKRSKNVIIS
ncbi:unnamed protein product [Ectocarpus sp. 13 AM-2016]